MSTRTISIFFIFPSFAQSQKYLHQVPNFSRNWYFLQLLTSTTIAFGDCIPYLIQIYRIYDIGMVKRNTDRGKGQRRMDNRDQKKTTRQKLISSISVGQISHRKWVSFSLPHRSPFLFTFSCYFHHSHLSISFAQMNG